MIISRQDILEVRRMSDCALVVREEFWDQQLRIYSQLLGIKLDKQQIDRVVVIIVDFAGKVSEAIIRLSEILYESFEKVWLSVKDTVKAQFRLAKMNYNILHHDRRC